MDTNILLFPVSRVRNNTTVVAVSGDVSQNVVVLPARSGATLVRFPQINHPALRDDSDS